MKDIFNYLYLNEKLSSSGMPTPEQVKEIAEAGKTVVINLATEKSEGAIPNEEELVTALGMKYIHIPVDWSHPTTENLAEFFAAMDTHKDNDIFVHCQANYRATAFISLYRIQRLGWKKSDAYAIMNKMWNPEDFPVWEKFMEENTTGY